MVGLIVLRNLLVKARVVLIKFQSIRFVEITTTKRLAIWNIEVILPLYNVRSSIIRDLLLINPLKTPIIVCVFVQAIQWLVPDIVRIMYIYQRVAILAY